MYKRISNDLDTYNNEEEIKVVCWCWITNLRAQSMGNGRSLLLFSTKKVQHMHPMTTIQSKTYLEREGNRGAFNWLNPMFSEPLINDAKK